MGNPWVVHYRIRPICKVYIQHGDAILYGWGTPVQFTDVNLGSEVAYVAVGLCFGQRRRGWHGA
jgi:hypothetical protein